MSKPYCSTKLALAEKSANRLIKKIEHAFAARKQARGKQLIKDYLNLPAAKYVAAVEAYRDMPNHHKTVGLDLSKVARSVDPFEGTDEPAVRHLKDKGYGEFRPYWDFGIENRTLQHLVKRVLLVQADLHPNQYAMRGTNLAVKEVLAKLNDGYCRVAEVDIIKYFTNVGVKKLPGYLHIPEKVISRVLSGEYLVPLEGNYSLYLSPEDADDILEGIPGSLYDVLQEGRQGLPQGSAASSLVGELLMTPLFSALPDCGVVVNYVDNFLVMAKTQSDFVPMINSLWKFVTEHPAGPFKLTIDSSSTHGEPFEFLGYQITCTDGTYTASPSVKNWKKFSRKFDRGIDQIKDKKRSIKWRIKRANDLKRYVREWSSAFNAWEKSDLHRARRLKNISEALACMGQNICA